MLSYQAIIEKIESLDLSKRAKGTMFEKISKFLLLERDTTKEYKKISFWSDWQYNNNEPDTGIDLVIETESGEFIAVQCKYRAEKEHSKDKLGFNDLGTFCSKLQSGVGDVKFSKGILITTTSLSGNLKNEIEQIRKKIPIDLIAEEDFQNSNIDWERINSSQEELPTRTKTLKEHQIEAIKATKLHFTNHIRGKLIMACGTGKTFTSLNIIEKTTPHNAKILFLAPSIALVAQTFREFCRDSQEPFIASIVCSDNKAGTKDSEDELFDILPHTPSTSYDDILKTYQKAKDSDKRFIVFSTYQSAERIKEAQALSCRGGGIRNI